MKHTLPSQLIFVSSLYDFQMNESFFVAQLKLLSHISFFCILLFYVPGLASSGQFSKSNCWEKLTCVKQSMLHRWILLLLFILLKSVATDIFILFLTIQ